MSIGKQAERQLVQTLRSDLNLICNEARKRYPAVREVSEACPSSLVEHVRLLVHY